MAKKNDDFSFEIVEHIEDLTDANDKGWKKEFNRVKWGDAKEPVYDIRSWNEDHTKMGKGITLSYEELALLCQAAYDKGIC